MSGTNGVAVREEASIAESIKVDAGQIMFEVLAKGDLSALSPEEIARYEVAVCRSMGLNPLTKPFDVITLPGNKKAGTPDRKVMYANRNASDQLTGIHKITREIVSREVVDGVYIVTARASTPDGRFDESIGAVPLMKEGGKWVPRDDGEGSTFKSDGTFLPLPPDQRANKMMHAETKAKRRAVLSLVGLSFLDESEFDTMSLPGPGTSVRSINGVNAPPSALSPGLNRNQEARDLINAIIGTFAIDPEGAKQIGEDLICLRFGIDQTADATAEHLRDVREAVLSWQTTDEATAALAQLRMIGSAGTATMIRDVEKVLGDQNVNDPFVLGALIERLDALELEEQRTESRNRTIDAITTPS